MISKELKFLSICYFHIHVHLTTTIEVDEMYENLKEMVPKIAIFDHDTIKKNYESKVYVMLNSVLLFSLLYFDSNYYSK